MVTVTVRGNDPIHGSMLEGRHDKPFLLTGVALGFYRGKRGYKYRGYTGTMEE